MAVDDDPGAVVGTPPSPEPLGGPRFRVLGPVEVCDEAGEVLDVGGRQPRVVLGLLLVGAGRTVPVDTLVDAIWGDEPPLSATGTLQTYVSRLRRRIERPAVPGRRATRLVREEAGYRLDVDADDVDFRRFEALAEQGRALLDGGRPDQAVQVLTEADALWRGPALHELLDVPAVHGVAARLEERRVAALEDRFAAALQTGRHAAVAGPIAEEITRHPLRERLREQYALALYRCGRQAEALRALADAARTLRDELGIEPSRPLRELEAAILAHDPALDLEPPRARSHADPIPAPTSAAPTAAPDRAVPPSLAPAEPRAAQPTPPGSGASAAGRGPALVGRTAELAQLTAALAESAGDARFVVVEGEPGIGKTRLVDELRAVASARGAVAVWGRADESGAAPALWPWLAPLRALAARVALDDGDAGGSSDALTSLLVGNAPTLPGQAAWMQFERFEAVAALFERVAAGTTVVVLLDDLQWADAASLELLAFLARRLERNVLVVATMRQLEVGRKDAVTDALAAVARRAGTRRFALRGLSVAETAAVLEGLDIAGSAHASASDIVAIHRRAEGNPFYAIELARLRGEELGSGEVPGSVADVIRRRLGHVSPVTADLLAIGGVIGRDVELGLLAGAAGLDLDACLEAVEPALVHRLLVAVPDQPSVLRFSHALVREVVLDDLSSLRRARLHLRVADAVEARGAGVDDVEFLAEHLYRAAAVGGAGRAAGALERAAEVAVQRVAYAAAEDLLKRAVQLRRVTSTASRADQEAELRAICRLVEVARARRYYAGASELDVLTRGKDLAGRLGRPDLVHDFSWVEWSTAATSCRISTGGSLIQALVDAAERDGSPVRIAEAQSGLGVRYWQTGRVAEALDLLERARAVLVQHPPAPGVLDLTAEQWMLNVTFLLHMRAITGASSPDEAIAAFDAFAAQHDDRFALASILAFASTTAMALGRWEDVERFTLRAAEVDPNLQFGFWGGMQLMQRAGALAWRGRTDEARTMFDEGRAVFAGVEGHSSLAASEATLAWHLAVRGELDAARHHAAQARAEIDAYGERWGEPIVTMVEAMVAACEGDADRARTVLERAWDDATGQGAHGIAARVPALAADLGLRVDGV